MVDSPMRILSFDRGIEQVLWAEGELEARLPSGAQRILPSEVQVSHHLEQLFNAPSLNHTLLDSLKADLQHKDLLIPRVYQQTMRDLHQALEQSLGTMPDSPEKTAITQALGVLAEERELSDLLNSYLNLLHRA